MLILQGNEITFYMRFGSNETPDLLTETAHPNAFGRFEICKLHGPFRDKDSNSCEYQTRIVQEKSVGGAISKHASSTWLPRKVGGMCDFQTRVVYQESWWEVDQFLDNLLNLLQKNIYFYQWHCSYFWKQNAGLRLHTLIPPWTKLHSQINQRIS